MEKRALGSTGFEIAPLVLGGNVFGWTADEKTSFASFLKPASSSTKRTVSVPEGSSTEVGWGEGVGTLKSPSGRKTETSVPTPGVESISIQPPCC